VTDEKKNEVLLRLSKSTIEALPNSEDGLIALCLVSEGYCVQAGGYGEKNSYTITGKGIDFITNGSYIGQTAKKLKEEKDKKNERLLSWISKLATVSTTIAVWGYKLFSKIFHFFF